MLRWFNVWPLNTLSTKPVMFLTQCPKLPSKVQILRACDYGRGRGKSRKRGLNGRTRILPATAIHQEGSFNEDTCNFKTQCLAGAPTSDQRKRLVQLLGEASRARAGVPGQGYRLEVCVGFTWPRLTAPGLSPEGGGCCGGGCRAPPAPRPPGCSFQQRSPKRHRP